MLKQSLFTLRSTKPVDGVPGLYVRSMTLAELHQITVAEDSAPEGQKAETGLLYTVLYTACNSTGEPLFTEDTKDEIRNLPTNVIVAVANAVKELNSPDAAKKN